LCKIISLTGTDHGASTKRKRGFALAIEIRESGITESDARERLKGMQTTITTVLKIPQCSPFEELMLSDDDDYLAKVYEATVEKTKKPKADTDWQGKFVQMLHGKGLTWAQVIAPKATQESDWYPHLPEREKMNLGFAMALHPDVRSVELSQMPGVGSCSRDDATNALLPNSKVRQR